MRVLRVGFCADWTFRVFSSWILWLNEVFLYTGVKMTVFPPVFC